MHGTQQRLTLQQYKDMMGQLFQHFTMELGQFENLIVRDDWCAIRYTVKIKSLDTGKDFCRTPWSSSSSSRIRSHRRPRRRGLGPVRPGHQLNRRLRSSVKKGVLPPMKTIMNLLAAFVALTAVILTLKMYRDRN